MNWNDLVILCGYFVQGIVIFMWMRSGYFLNRVRQEIDNYNLVVLGLPVVIGTLLSIYNLYDIDYILMRFPAKAFLNIVCAFAIYVFSRSKKENLWNITNVLKRELSTLEVVSMKKIKAGENEVEIVTEETLENISYNKAYTDKLTSLIKVKTPDLPSVRFKFNVDVLKDGVFGVQRHPTLREEIYVDEGMVEEIYSKKIYRAGEVIVIPKNEPHGLKGLCRASVSAYLFKE